MASCVERAPATPSALSGIVPFKKLFTTVEPSRYSADIEEYNEANKHRKTGFLSPDNSAYDLK